MTTLLGLDVHSYTPHTLHGANRLFPETNCYTDLWIELVHALGHEPTAMLAFCVIADWEGDQWTFVKPPPVDLEQLYGAEIQEYIVYRTLPEHLAEQVALGRWSIVEVDGYHLPDTVGRSYRTVHEKTSVAVESIDQESEILRYFHGPGFFELSGVDYREALRVGRPYSADVLPPYIEFIRFDRLEPCPAEELPRLALSLLERQLERRPPTNPVERFGERLCVDLPAMLGGDADAYHLYAFATLRQCGAAWEAASSFLAWLAQFHPRLAGSDEHFRLLAADSKTMLFKLARAATRGRSFDPAPDVEVMASRWAAAMQGLSQAL
jgi:hypothetical protein